MTKWPVQNLTHRTTQKACVRRYIVNADGNRREQLMFSFDETFISVTSHKTYYCAGTWNDLRKFILP